MTSIRALIATFLLTLLPIYVFAAPYAAIVLDAKTGSVLHAENENTRLHPAGLTKLATLYEVFSAVEAGEYYNMRISIAAEAKDGLTWADTH